MLGGMMLFGISKLLVSFAIRKATYKFHIVRKVQYAIFSHKIVGEESLFSKYIVDWSISKIWWI